MSASSSAPGAQHQRFAAYLNSLAQAAGHVDRAVPLESYSTGLLLPSERKTSISCLIAVMKGNSFEDQHVQSALQKIELFFHGRKLS